MPSSIFHKPNTKSPISIIHDHYFSFCLVTLILPHPIILLHPGLLLNLHLQFPPKSTEGYKGQDC